MELRSTAHGTSRNLFFNGLPLHIDQSALHTAKVVIPKEEEARSSRRAGCRLIRTTGVEIAADTIHRGAL